MENFYSLWKTLPTLLIPIFFYFFSSESNYWGILIVTGISSTFAFLGVLSISRSFLFFSSISLSFSSYEDGFLPLTVGKSWWPSPTSKDTFLSFGGFLTSRKLPNYADSFECDSFVELTSCNFPYFSISFMELEISMIFSKKDFYTLKEESRAATASW